MGRGTSHSRRIFVLCVKVSIRRSGLSSGCPRRIVLDGGRENLDLTKDLLQHYRIKGTTISAFHPQANRLVERGHGPIVNSIAKYCDQPADWPKYLPLALWADRITIRRSTGYSAFELLYGRECLLPVELAIESWSVVDWEEVKSREELILARMKQLDWRKISETQAATNLKNSRRTNKDYFDQHKRLCPKTQQLRVGDLVLLINGELLLSRNRQKKINNRWHGLYRIREVAEDSTFYRLEELDGTPLTSSITGNRLRRS